MIEPTVGPVPKEALDYFKAKGYKLGWSYLDVWREEHTRAFTVAKAMTQELLMDIRQVLDDALEQGLPFETFQETIEPILGDHGWLGKKVMPDGKSVELGTPRRLKIIYQTNMRVARTAGQWERIERNQKLLPYLIYSLGPSKEHRPHHVQWEGLVLPADDSFWDTHTPPNGWGCRCRVRPITRREAEKRGVSQRPKIEKIPWENKRTGQVEQVPKDIDPGWDYNPGKSRLEQTKKFGADTEAKFKKTFFED